MAPEPPPHFAADLSPAPAPAAEPRAGLGLVLGRFDPPHPAGPSQEARRFHRDLEFRLTQEGLSVCRLTGTSEQRRARALEALETLLLEPVLPAR